MRRPEPIARCHRRFPGRVAPYERARHRGAYLWSTAERRLKGLVTLDDTLEAVRAGRGLEEIITTDIPTVTLDTPLTDIISLIAESPYPVAGGR